VSKLAVVEKKDPQPSKALVEMLEQLLDRARAGKLVSMAYAAEYRDERTEDSPTGTGVEWAVAGYRWNSGLLGGLSLIQAKLAGECLEK
jgi:hypothetical protein